MNGYEERGTPIKITDGETECVLRKVYSNGERVKIVCLHSGDYIYLDPLELESITWQHPNDLDSSYDDSLDTTDTSNLEYGRNRSDSSESESIIIKNEFTEVHILSLDKDKVNIESPKLGYSIVLGPGHIQSIAKLRTDDFSSLLSNPFGPENEPTIFDQI